VDARLDSGDVGPISGPTKVCRWLRALAAEWEDGSSCYSNGHRRTLSGLYRNSFRVTGIYIATNLPTLANRM
jgi:hypothetical protein